MKNRLAHISYLYKNDLILLLLPCVVSSGLAAIDSNSFPEIFKYWVYYFAAVIPLSYISSTVLLKKFELSFFQKIALGYGPTIVVTSIGYFVLESIGLSSLVFAIPFASITWLFWRITKNKQAIESSARQTKLSFSIGLLILYLLGSISLFTHFTITTITPDQGISGNVYEDTLWTVGNTWSILKNGFPVQDLRFVGVPLGYHIGQNIYYAFISKLTTINPIYLHLKIAPYFDLFFFCSALAASANVFLGTKERSSWVLLLPVLFSATEITSFKAGGPATYHEIYTNPISFAFGLGSFLILLIVLSQKYFLGVSKKKIPLLYTLALFTLAVSTKGIIGVLLPGSIIALLIGRWFFKKLLITREDILLIASMTAILFALKLTIFDGSGGWLVAPQIEISPVAIKIAAQFGLQEWVSSIYFLIGPISRSTRFLFHVIIWNWSSIALIISLLVYKVSQKEGLKEIKILHIGLAFVGICSVLYGANIMDNYWANLYYYKYSLAIVTLLLGVIGVRIIELMLDGGKQASTTNKIVLTCGTLTVFTPSIIDLGAKISYGFRQTKVHEIAFEQNHKQSIFLSGHEYNALTWMRENLPPSSIIASDRKDKAALSGDYVLSVWFNYSAYSGFQFYNEGDEYNPYQVRKVSKQRWSRIQNLLNATDAQAAIEAWNLINADYLIISKSTSPDSFTKNYLGDTIFKNSDIKIVKRPRSAEISE